jgi:N-acetylglucosaminyldiphosphoundecaprenol N-acetyl-beta-D-mannosaminyltransferase
VGVGSKVIGCPITRIRVTGVPVHILPADDVDAAVEYLLSLGTPEQIVMIDAWDLMRSRWNQDYRRVLEQAACVVPISSFVCWGASTQLNTTVIRYTPFDLVIRILGAVEARRRSIYILGGTPHTLRKAEGNLAQTFPGIRFIGRYTGFYPGAREPDILTAIRKASPDLVLTGSGVPGNDNWVVRNRSALPGGIYIWAQHAFEVFGEKRKHRSQKTIEDRVYRVLAVILRPWRIYRAPVYLWYIALVLYYKWKNL